MKREMRIGTCYFVTATRALSYYKSQGFEDAWQAVKDKLDAGEIHVGVVPSTTLGEWLELDADGRYEIVSTES